VGVCAAHSKRVDTGALTAVYGPRNGFAGYSEAATLKGTTHHVRSLFGKARLPARSHMLTLGVRPAKLDIERNHSILESSARTHLRMEVRPEAPSEWPTFGWLGTKGQPVPYGSGLREEHKLTLTDWKMLSSFFRDSYIQFPVVAIFLPV
jgi:hypothetical protein